MAIRKFRKNWGIDFRFNHIRYRMRSPENSKNGAEAYEAVLRQKLARGESLTGQNKEKQEQEQTFKEFSSQWFKIYVKANNRDSEQAQKKYSLQKHLTPFFGEISIDKITTLEIEKFKANKIKQGLNPKTINNYLMVLSKCLRTAQEWLNLEKMPKIKRLKIPPQKFDFMSPEESDFLLASVNGVWREIIFTALKTGLRIGELRALDWSDIDFFNKTLNVNHSWCNHKKGLVSPKSNKARQIPLTDELFKILEGRKQIKGLVFTDERGKRFNCKRLNLEIGKACKKAGLREITCHTLRHTFASHLAMAGASIQKIQSLLGHSNVQITMRYAHLTPSSLREAINLLEPKPMSMSFGQQAVNKKQHPVGVAMNDWLSGSE